MATIEKRVEKGAKWLDTQKPGWEKKVPIERLYSVKGLGCMADLALGENGYYEVMLSGIRASEHGFNASIHEDAAVVKAWKQLVYTRRANLPLPMRKRITALALALIA